jgi:hypothetical protein
MDTPTYAPNSDHERATIELKRFCGGQPFDFVVLGWATIAITFVSVPDIGGRLTAHEISSMHFTVVRATWGGCARPTPCERVHRYQSHLSLTLPHFGVDPRRTFELIRGTTFGRWDDLNRMCKLTTGCLPKAGLVPVDLLPAFWTTRSEDFLIISRAGRGEKDDEGF